MSHSPREIGTLIIVIDKANHLPNKRHIGKQDPYCAIEFEGRKGRTKTIKKGGQHPEWDEELRFPVFEDVEDELARTAEERAPSPPPKDGALSKPEPKKTSRSKRVMKLACWADDARDPELIGETLVDLTTVLTKGEQDGWQTLMHKEKFAGKVYLELTFYSNEEPPPKATKRPDYAGPGDFIGDPKKTNGQSRTVSTPHFPREQRTALRNPSGSMLELYTPPYDTASSRHSMNGVADDFGQLSILQHSRRESFPPLNGQPTGQSSYHHPRHSMSLPVPSDSYEPSIPDSTSTYSTLSYPSYPSPYETAATPGPGTVKSSIRGPRYSVPASSSGFMPLSARALPSHPSEPSGFAPSMYSNGPPMPYASHFTPSMSYTPMPASMSQSHTPMPQSHTPMLQSHTPMPQSHTPIPPQSHTPMPPQSHTPMPSQSHTPIPPSASSMMQYQQYPYSQYPPPPQQYAHSHSPHHIPPPPPPQQYASYPGTPSPPNEPSASISTSSLNSSQGPGGSRPLPQPHQAPQYPPGQPPYANSVMFPSAYPPPPPPPLVNGNSPPRSPHQHQHSPHQVERQYSDPNMNGHIPPPPPALPPPPPPPISTLQYEPRRRSSLPQPPTTTPSRGALPIPPGMPPHMLPQPPSHLGMPSMHSQGQIQSYIPGPPPRPPQMTEEGHWVPPPQQPYGMQAGAGWA